jgi:putative glutamine amidotransferase
MKIAFTDPMTSSRKLELYLSWLTAGRSDIEVVVLSHTHKNAGRLAECAGLVLSGGGDVDPALYGREDLRGLCKGIDRDRDSFEFEVFASARSRNLPVLGVCRGLQVLNVALSGDLIADVESKGYHRHSSELNSPGSHGIVIGEGSILRTIAGAERMEVNTFHHQAVNTPGKGMAVTSRSDDGVVESLELPAGSDSPFLVGVQWHPERFTDPAHPLGAGLRDMLYSHC